MMEIDMDKRHWEHGPCPKHDCRKDSCKCGLRLISFPAALGDDSKGSPVAPKNGDYCNALVKYESNGHIYVYSTEGVPALIYDGDSGCECDSNIVVGLENGMTTYPAGTAPISFDDALAAFQNGQSIFFTDHTFRMDDMYTVSAIESHDGIWSMKVERVGMDLQNDEGFWVVKAHNPTEWRSVDFFKSVIDPATETQVETVVSKIGDLEDLQTTDKDTVVGAINEIVSGGGGGGPTVVQAPGVSTTSVMSQNAATKMVYQVLEGNFPSVVSGAIQIDPTYAGAPSQVTDQDYGDVIMIGRGASTTGSGSCRSIQIGAESQASINGMALGFKAIETSGEGVALGAFSKTGTANVVSVGNSDATTYVDIYGQTVTVPAFTRRIINVSTPTSTNDAATKWYVDDRVGAEVTARQGADNNLQSQIDAITVSSDVVDVLGTYAELQAYDTSHIKANDIIKVIQDSTHNNAMSYYRWVITNNVGAWSYVGSEGPFYTKSETDTLLNAKANTSDIVVYTAGTGISIQNGVISLSLTSAESESF